MGIIFTLPSYKEKKWTVVRGAFFTFFCLLATVFLICIGNPLFSDEQGLPDWKTEIQEIDVQIQDLTELRNRYRASAARKEDEANRWQFKSGEFNETRRAWQGAEEDRKKAQLLQEEIDALEQKKQKILKLHPGN